MRKVLKCVVTGFPHSGTTMLSEMIRQSPLIDGRWEAAFLYVSKPIDFLDWEWASHSVQKTWGVTREELTHILSTDCYHEAYCRLLDLSKEIVDKNVMIYDKAPHYMENLTEILGRTDVPCVIITRDPRSVFWSHKRRWQPRNVKSFCERYVKAADEHVSAVDKFGDRCLTVHYENLCRNPMGFKEVYDFLELPFEDRFIESPVISEHSKNNAYGSMRAKMIYEHASGVSKEEETYILKSTARHKWTHLAEAKLL